MFLNEVRHYNFYCRKSSSAGHLFPFYFTVSSKDVSLFEFFQSKGLCECGSAPLSHNSLCLEIIHKWANYLRLNVSLSTRTLAFLLAPLHRWGHGGTPETVRVGDGGRTHQSTISSIISRGWLWLQVLDLKAMVLSASSAWLMRIKETIWGWFHDDQDGFFFVAYSCGAQQILPSFSTIYMNQRRKSMVMSVGAWVHIRMCIICMRCILFWCCVITLASLSAH